MSDATSSQARSRLEQQVFAVVGDAFLDVVVEAHDNYGDDEQITGATQLRVGGTAALMAMTAARLGREVRLLGRIGADRLGAVILEHLAASGIDVQMLAHGRTGRIACVVMPTGRRFIVDVGAESLHRDEVTSDRLVGASWLHLTGYWLKRVVTDGRYLDELAESCRRLSLRLSIDLGNVTTMAEIGRGRLRALLRTLRPSIVFSTKEEADSLHGAMSQPIGETTLIATNGNRPTIVKSAAMTEFLAPPSSIDTAWDPVGAGDAFTAGTISALLTGSDVLEAVAAGHSSAADFIASYDHLCLL